MAAAADPTVAAIGPRVKALREAMDLSLRDLAERSGVSAPMLSQVERGETSPTLQVAAASPPGLELRLSQLLRLDEETARSRSSARGEGRRGGAGGHAYEVLTPPLPGLRAEVTRHTLAPGAVTGGPGDPPRHEPGARETAFVERRRGHAAHRRRRARAARRRLRHLRRRPAPPLRQPLRGGGRPAGHRVRRPAPLMTPTTLFEKIWSAHEIAPGLIYIDLHLVHEVTSPQAFEGLRLAGREVRRPDRTLATADHNVPTDGTPVVGADQGRALAPPGRGARGQLRRVRHPAVLARLRPPGDRAHHRPRARRHPAGHDDRLRRLPHRHPRRVRRAGVRHRHERGRARPGHPDARPAQAEVDADQLRRARSAAASPPRT